VHTLPVMSGSGINTLLTMKGSRDQGHEVALACASSGRLTEEALKEGMAVHLISRLRREVNPLMDPAAVFELRRLIGRHRFDLVHTHNSKAGFVGRLAARRARVPTLVHTVHGFAFHDEESAFRRALFRRLERVAARWCDGMIFISKPLLDWAERERIGPGIPRTVIFSGIDVDVFRSADGKGFRRQWNIPPDRLVVGMVSKLWKGKGHEILLDAWKATLRDIRIAPEPLLLIVGEGHLEAKLKKRVSSLGLDTSVQFTGFQWDIPAATAAIDIAVLPSLFEGMGRVVLEAMASGKAVIASDVGGIPDLVRHGENGLLVRPRKRESLQQALVELLSNAELRTKLGENGFAGFRSEYRASYMVEQIHRFYEELGAMR
jgi:glycosyltransferase involved in cell wall biosynthesis